MKYCNRCQTEKPRADFAKRAGVASGLQSKCRACSAEIYAAKKANGKVAEYREANKDRLMAQSRAAYEKTRFCPKEKERRRSYYLENRERILQKRKDDQPKTNKRNRERAAASPILGICRNLKARLAHSARTMGAMVTCGKALRGERLLIKQRLEMNFLPGMTWANYGEWQVDHVKPLAAFVVKGQDVNLANLRCNLRPAWASDNQRKSAMFKGVSFRIPFPGKSAQNQPSI